MKQYLDRTIFWWPATLRLFLFSIMTSGGVLMSQIDGMKTADFVAFGWVEWLRFMGPVAAAFLGTIIAFLDQTMGKLREQSDTQIWKAGQTI